MVAAPQSITFLTAALAGLEGSLAPGYTRAAGSACTGNEAYPDAVARHSCRWLAQASPPPGEPFAVELAMNIFTRRVAALCALTSRPVLPAGMAVRQLFPPRIGDESVAIRADLTEAGERFVLYRVDFLVDCTVLSFAGAWRWPSGSPGWLYARGRRLAAVLRGAMAPALDSSAVAR